MDSSTLTFWTGQFPKEWVSGWILLLPCFIEIPVSIAKNVDPDQTPRLNWVYTVCQCPFYGTLGINGLSFLFCSSGDNQLL